MKFSKQVQTVYEVKAFNDKPIPLDGLTFDKWMKTFGVSLDSMKSQWGLEDEDLRHRYHIEEDEENFNEVTDEIEAAFKADIGHKFNQWIGKFKYFKYPLTLYRALGLKDVKELKWNKLGTDWSDEIKSAQVYNTYYAPWGHNTFVVRVEVKKSDVDWGPTIWNNLNESFGEAEQEINLRPGKKVKVTGIQHPNDKWEAVSKVGTI